ncbi:MAG: hypothetical protein K2I75_04320 [Clostridiales bacterium]|nr:hypothetical protein [Clostridiales bacterium]
MKKTVKSLIIAASVAAIAGIGAVSFAAWNNGATNTTAKNDATLGSVTITGGFVKTGENSYEALTTTDTNLVPYDQGSGTMALVFDIPNYQVLKDTGYTLTLTTDKLESKFKYQIGDAAATAPTTATDFASWGTAAGTAIEYKDANAPTANATITGKKLTVILDSSDLGDMGAGITFTLTYAEVA